MSTRREFIRRIGVILTSLAATHCAPLPLRGRTPRDRLRKCWLDLDRLEKQGYERRQEFGNQLQADHRAALDQLVEAEELDPAVAEHVHALFDHAVRHIWASLATCYEAVPWPDYVPAARGQVIEQADLLAELAKESALDPQVVAQAQAALERDAALLHLSEDERNAFYAELAGAGTPYPPLDELDLEIEPEAVEAARFLVQVLLQE